MTRFQRTLIVEQNREYVLQIREMLSGLIDEVEFCFDGKKALEIYRLFHPDLILAEVILPKLDGFALMEQLLSDTHPVKIMLASINHDLIIKKAFALKADYLLVKPYHKATFAQRICEAADYRQKRQSTADDGENMLLEVSTILKTLGVPANMKGYRYLQKALQIACRDMGALDALNDKIYTPIAQQSKTSGKCVERNIRHAIETSALRGDTEAYSAFFGYTVNSNKGKPTNGEFIAALADRINLSKKENK